MEIVFSYDSFLNHTLLSLFNCNLSFQEAKRNKIHNISFSPIQLLASTALHFHWQGRPGNDRELESCFKKRWIKRVLLHQG